MLHRRMPSFLRKGYEAMGKVALSIGANTFQFFTRNPRGSKAKAIDEQDISRFLKLAGDNGFGILLAHAPYTLNPCSADPKVTCFCGPGPSGGPGADGIFAGQPVQLPSGQPCRPGSGKGIELVAAQLNDVLSSGQTTTVLLETMSGKGSEIGKTFEELAAIIERVELKENWASAWTRATSIPRATTLSTAWTACWNTLIPCWAWNACAPST